MRQVPVLPVEQVTGFPELLDGRVKTLHPAIHGALLARRNLPEHVAALEQHGIVPIDLVAVNLYPFQLTVAREDASFEDAVENIDVGGPSMLRSAAKNHESVLPVVDPTDYPVVLELLRSGGLTPEIRRDFAAKVFAHTADYDAAIAGYLTPEAEGLPARMSLAMERVQPLRYGENPDQRAALYVTEEPRGHAGPDPAPGQGALVQQSARRGRRDVGGGVLVQSSGLRRHQAHHTLRHCGGIVRSRKPSGRLGPPTQSRPSAR